MKLLSRLAKKLMKHVTLPAINESNINVEESMRLNDTRGIQ